MVNINIIRDKYPELIRLISLIGDSVKIYDKAKLSLNIDIFTNHKKLVSFKLYQTSETSQTLEIAWGLLNYNIGHWSFPDHFNQNFMFNKLISKISDWQREIINCDINKAFKNAHDITDDINKVFLKDWTLIDFCRKFGPKMVVTISTNKTTGEKFPNCIVINEEGKRTYVGFYSRLGPLTSEEIERRKNDLFVGLVMSRGKEKYYLHSKDILTFEEIDISLLE